VELRTWCRVKEINVGEDGLASGVTYFDAGGVEQFQPDNVVIMALQIVQAWLVKI